MTLQRLPPGSGGQAPPLPAAEDSLRILVDAVMDHAIVGLAPDGCVTSWNAGAERILGWQADQTLGQPFARFLPLAGAAGLPDQGGTDQEIRVQRRDGTEFVAQVSTTPAHDRCGRPLGTLKIIRDITDQRQREAGLRSSEAQLRSVLDTVPDGVIVIDERGVILVFSAAAERMFLYSAGQIIGRNVSTVIPGAHGRQHDSYIARYLATGERRIIGIGRVVTGLRRDGSTFPIELAVGEIEVDGQRLFAGFIRDITERQHMDRRVQELQAELMHLSRVGELGQMVSALAHEINQPLAAVGNYLSAGLRLLGTGHASAGAAFGKALEQTKRADQIIRRLRSLVKRGEGSRRPENLCKTIEEACALALIGVKEHDIRVVFQLPASGHLASIDRIQIQQVLLNLIRNAVEALIGAPRRQLTIRMRAIEKEMIEIAILDTGPGLPEDVRQKLFQPFVTTKEEGLGVGLSVCRSIVEAHGGRIWAEENPGGGTAFLFTVPRGPEESDASDTDMGIVTEDPASS